ncbi:putative cytochrome P460 [Caballeronia insecticola]|uniref:Putative cytochrome P460 n=1 Tax=Caballeronia insecticola TaxID=758793 RepID=R4X3H1_9BURK|nr:putative cytochrome P460 [Caballeronia insecticola]
MIVLALISTSLSGSIALSTEAEENASPVFGVTLPAGYRDWQFISVAHEAGNNNDIRGILGNDIAMKALKEGKLPFPDGSIIVRLAYEYVSSERNNAIFGREQSFVAGAPTNVQIEVKDSKRYANTGGWGYGQFENGKANPSVKIVNSCFACHAKLPSNADFVFTTYSR